MKNLKYIDCVALTSLESQQINGGTDRSTTLWDDIAFLGESFTRGLALFGTEGGRNAGISVR